MKNLRITYSQILGTLLIFVIALNPISGHLRVADSIVTIDRISLLLLALFTIKFYLRAGNSRSNLVAFPAVLFATLAVCSYFLHAGHSREIFLSYLLFIGLIVFVWAGLEIVSKNAGSKRAMSLVYRSFFVWFAVVVFFSCIAIYHQSLVGVTYYPVLENFNLVDSLDQRYKMQMRAGRLFQPFPSAPMLGLLCFFLVLFFSIDRNRLQIFNGRTIVIISLVLIVFGFMTKSRSAIYPLIMLIPFYFITKQVVTRKVKNYIYAFVILSAAIALFFLFGNISSVDLSRLSFDSAELVESRHFSIRTYTVGLVADGTLNQLLFGHGIGYLQTTGIAPYTFTSYLTILLELGLVGLFLYSAILAMPTLLVLIRGVKSSYVYKGSEIVLLNSYLVFANLFYEFKTLAFVGSLIGILIFMATQRYSVVLPRRAKNQDN